MEGFEVFDKRTAKSSKVAYVTIQRRGLVSLNEAAFQGLHGAEAVELLYNRAERVIGLRAVDPKAPHAFPVRRQGVGHNYLVAGQAFSTYYGIDTTTARRYLAQFRNGMLLIDLKEAGADATGVRARKGDRAETKPANVIGLESQRA